MTSRFPWLLFAAIPAVLSFTSCADLKIAHEFPSAYNGGHRNFGYAGTPTEAYKQGYECGHADRREHRSRDARRHGASVPTELQDYYATGYADGYAGKVRPDCQQPCWETTLERRTYSGTCCSGDKTLHSK